MKKMHASMMVGMLVLAVGSGKVLADYYDCFDNNIWGPDANYSNMSGITGVTTSPPPLLAHFDANYSWEVDNPQWWVYKLMCNPSTSFVDANSGAARVVSQAHPYIPEYAVMGIAADDNNQDANTSSAYWDDTTNHYVLIKVYYPGYYGHQDDPNYDRGKAGIVIHGHPQLWTGLVFEVDFHTCALSSDDPNISLGYEGEKWYTQHGNLQGMIATDVRNIQRFNIDPNGMRAQGSTDPSTRTDPNDVVFLSPPEARGGNPYRMPDYNGDPSWKTANLDQWERDGFWMLMQFEIDPNYAPGDPNGKYLRGAIWSGDKYDWNGNWLVSYHLADPWWSSGDSDPNYYAKTGRTALMSWTGTPGNPGYGNGFPGDVVYDNVEARTDIFNSIPRLLDVKVVKPQYATSIKVAPNLLLDPNDDDPNVVEDELYYRFTDGTPVVMTATPISGKAFRDWTIWSDPSKYPDANYAVVDANAVLHLVMDGDKIVEATFKCGSGIAPLMGVGLFVLALAVVVRRLA